MINVKLEIETNPKDNEVMKQERIIAAMKDICNAEKVNLNISQVEMIEHIIEKEEEIELLEKSFK